MGLFGSRKMCPICGKPAGRLFPTKIEKQPLCSECSAKAGELPLTMDSSALSLEKFREFLSFYDENAALRGAFQQTYQYTFGIFGGVLSLDVPKRLFRFNTTDTCIVFEAQNLRSFRILEDFTPLFEGTKDALNCYQSEIPARVGNMGPDIDRFEMARRQHEQIEEMDKVLKERAKETGEPYTPSYSSAPNIDDLKPFKKFYIKMEVEHPFWEKQEYEEGAPSFDSYRPTIAGYMREYEGKVEELRELAHQLMAVLNPDAPEQQAGSGAAVRAGSAQTAPTDAVAEIQRYKDLLDSGAITEEEFTAKKRQLLGI